MLFKAVLGFVIAAQVLFFTILPYYYKKLVSNKRFVLIFENFSAGLFMGIAFLHIIPEANEHITDYLKASTNAHGHSLPYGSLVSILTFIAILTLEAHIHDGMCAEPERQHKNYHMHEILNRDRSKQRKGVMFETYITQIALSVHCFFECMSIGIEQEDNLALVLASAIMFHKWAEGLTLGFSYLGSGMELEVAVKFALCHAVLNGSAVMIGYYLSETNSLIHGIANGISAGTFLYVSIIEKIDKNFQHKKQIWQKVSLLLCGLLFSILILH